MTEPLAELIVSAVARHADVEYADVRVVRVDTENIVTQLDRPERVERETSIGVGIRVLVGGAWGFAASSGLSEPAAMRAQQTAIAVARAARGRGAPVRLADEAPQVGTYASEVGIDPWSVPLEQKLEDLSSPLLDMPLDPRILRAEGRMFWRRETKSFASSQGARIQQTLTGGGASLRLVAASDGEVAARTWPMEMDGGVGLGGYERVHGLELARHAPRLQDEALALLTAPLCPSGTTSLLLDTPQLSFQIHETCGHPAELDRALGEERAWTGASFLRPEARGRFQYGSNWVDLTADASLPGGLGTFGWDDEGVPAQRTPIVEAGRFVGYLSSRETAARIGLARSGGCMRAESWDRPPIIRMTNVSLEPRPEGPASLEALVEDTREGILMDNNRSWSIDDQRLGFQFGCEAAWEIRRGRRTRLLRRPVYSGTAPQFWSRCDAVCGPDAFRVWGLFSCGKGEPLQLCPVGHGCAPARFHGVEVGTA